MYKFLDEKGEHLHMLDEKPLIGTSSVTGVIAKTLTWWASGLAVAKFGWTNPKEVNKDERIRIANERYCEIMEMLPGDYLALLDEAYAAHSKLLKTSATKGTDMHAELEKYVKWCIFKFDGKPQGVSWDAPEAVKKFSEWSQLNVKRFIVSEGHCYSSRLWTGGITDCMAELNNGQVGIIDFKSAKEAYDSHFIQVAGYDIEQSESGLFDKDGNLIDKAHEVTFYAVIPFGAPKFTVEMRYNVEEYKRGFEAALVLYKIINHK